MNEVADDLHAGAPTDGADVHPAAQDAVAADLLAGDAQRVGCVAILVDLVVCDLVAAAADFWTGLQISQFRDIVWDKYIPGEEFVVNADLIRFVEARPDTLVTLTTDERFMVREDVDDVVRRVIEYARTIRMVPT